MAISLLPSLSRSDPAFKSNVDTFFGTQLPNFSSEINTEINRINQIGFGSYSATSTTPNTIGTGTKTFTIETGKSFVAGQVVIISDSANVSNYMVGQVSSYVSNTGVLTLTVSSVGGSGSISSWVVGITVMSASTGLGRLNKTSSYTLTKQDSGFIVDCSGAWTLALTAAATLGAGWWCYVRNIGTGTITADPNASELIDGVTSGAIRPGMTLLIQCDGAAFHCVRVGPQVAMEALTSGTSWTCPLGVRTVRLRQSGGGAGGVAAASGSAGSCGGYLEAVFVSVPGSSYSYSIGAAGNAGGGGGTTTFTANGITYSSTGGGAASSFTQSVPGTSSNGVINSRGATGDAAQSGTPVFEGAASPIGYGSGGKTNLPGTQGAIILEY